MSSRILMPIRKVAATALAALVTATGFLAWLAGTGELDWRGWLAIVFTAIAPPVAAYIIPGATDSPDGWWPLRKIAGAIVTALAASTVFLAWLGGTGELDWRTLAGILAAAVLPNLAGFFTGGNVPAGGAPLAPAEPDFITAS